MSEKRNKTGETKGKRISGKKANTDKYIPFYEFLLYDPKFQEVPDKAKIIYCYLRNKVIYFEKQTEMNEQGIEGTKSYLDENEEVYVVADNVELTYLFQTSEPTLIKMKKVLHQHGLLEEVSIKDGPNRIYPLEPTKEMLSDVWVHIEEIKKLREKSREQRKEKHLKMKAKKNSEKNIDNELSNSNSNEIVENTGDLKSLSHGNLKSLSHGDLKNLSQIKPKSLNLEPNSFKYNLTYQPILEEIDSVDLPNPIKDVLKNSVGRLVSDEISIFDIKPHFLTTVNNEFTIEDYANLLHSILTTAQNKIGNITGLLNSWLSTYKKPIPGSKNVSKKPKPVRQEKLPDWYGKDEFIKIHNDKTIVELKDLRYEIEAVQQEWLEEIIKKKIYESMKLENKTVEEAQEIIKTLNNRININLGNKEEHLEKIKVCEEHISILTKRKEIKEMLKSLNG